MEHSEYLQLRQRALREGWHHWLRIAASRDRIPAVEVLHCIPFTDPYDLDAPTKVLHPSPRFIAELMAGGIHPPIEALHNQRLRLETDDGTISSAIECTKLEAPAIRAKHKVTSETVIDNSAAHLTVGMPMSYEAAIEYCVMLDIPHDVWGVEHNRRMWAIVPRSSMPTDRTHRNEWKLRDIAA